MNTPTFENWRSLELAYHLIKSGAVKIELCEN